MLTKVKRIRHPAHKNVWVNGLYRKTVYGWILIGWCRGKTDTFH